MSLLGYIIATADFIVKSKGWAFIIKWFLPLQNTSCHSGSVRCWPWLRRVRQSGWYLLLTCAGLRDSISLGPFLEGHLLRFLHTKRFKKPFLSTSKSSFPSSLLTFLNRTSFSVTIFKINSFVSAVFPFFSFWRHSPPALRHCRSNMARASLSQLETIYIQFPQVSSLLQSASNLFYFLKNNKFPL